MLKKILFPSSKKKIMKVTAALSCIVIFNHFITVFMHLLEVNIQQWMILIYYNFFA
jgi:hypothetical protein